MTDQFDELEAELSRMRPRAMSAELLEGIESRMARGDGNASALRKSLWRDRLLIFSMGSGAIAACVIVGLLVLDSARSIPAGQAVSAIAHQSQPTVRDYSLAYARADLAR